MRIMSLTSNDILYKSIRNKTTRIIQTPMLKHRYTDCDELPSMNEAKLQWCRMSNVQIDYDDEDEDEEDLEMITIERNSEMRRSISGQSLKNMSTEDVERSSKVKVRVRRHSNVDTVDTFHSACSKESSEDGKKTEEEIPSALDDFRRMSTNFDSNLTDSGSASIEKRRLRSHHLHKFVPFQDFVKKFEMPRGVLRPNLTGEVKSYQTFGEPQEFKACVTCFCHLFYTTHSLEYHNRYEARNIS